MPEWTHEDWRRLGRAVYEARREAGLRKTPEWAAKVGRSSRTLLGLERGEQVGASTLEDIEDALGWQRGRTVELLRAESPQPTTTPDVGGSVEDAIRNDPHLLPEARDHLLRQYGLLRRIRSAAEEAALAQMEAHDRAMLDQAVRGEIKLVRTYDEAEEGVPQPEEG